MIVSRPTASMSRAPIQSQEFSAGTAMNGVTNSAQAHHGARIQRHPPRQLRHTLRRAGVAAGSTERLPMGGTIVDSSLEHGRKLRR